MQDGRVQPPTIPPPTHEKRERATSHCPPAPTTISCKHDRAASTHPPSPLPCPSCKMATSPTHYLHYHLRLASGPRHLPTTIHHPLVQMREGRVTHPPSPLPPPTRERATSPAHHHQDPRSPGTGHTLTTTMGLLTHHREGIALI